MKHPSDPQPRTLRELSRQKSLRLLGNVGIGRIAFISRAMPAIRLVSHIVNGDHLLIGCLYEPEIAAILGPRGTSMIVYQANLVDPATHLGWNVVVSGRAALMADPVVLARVGPQLDGWKGGRADLVLRIQPELVTGLHVGQYIEGSR
ncbi:pyridoxamine 5'-phosphate oxidase family protein [Nonomuraea guangzhouensis]|uniref:Pyridoxamine 5'-phosphate oxidase family protein n=1 Tax=Nonomuraea guangzhouensis TaxID=1291555 RepID=A0ABW4GSG6_9ACTN|nr:pyridoxamine 5'-phosphate oxidase family protein [Nonomuraea guangzhouensis]